MESKIIETTDTTMSAAIQTAGYSLKGIYKNERNDVVFQFIVPMESDVIQDYYRQKILVPPQLFLANLKELKNLVNQKNI